MDLVKIKNSSKKAFTLIELLVVITIIGILATGSVSIYTSQIQKARDTTRINDVEALKSGVEQFYQDNNQYPSVSSGDTYYFTGVTTYTPKLPKDPKSGQTCNGDGTNTPICAYIYGVNSDNNGIEYGEYEISTAYENAGNRTSKAIGDNGNDDLRYEVGLDVGDTNTKCNITTKKTITTLNTIDSTICNSRVGTVVSGGIGSIFIAGN